MFCMCVCGLYFSRYDLFNVCVYVCTYVCMYVCVEALIFRDRWIAENPIWNGIPDFLPKHY